MEISFVTLFLGLVVGPHPVELGVTGPVAAIELRLDGRTVATLRGSPWTTRCDFGEDLLPHRLEAVATDSSGTRHSSAVQWVNLPRAAAEVSIALERDDRGRPVAARVAWESLQFSRPERIDVSLDGVPLAPSGEARFALPRRVKDRLHFLAARASFPGDLAVTTELAFGGELGAEARAQLTAIPVVLEPGAELPPPEDLQGWLLDHGEPLRVIAVERGPADVVIVRDASTNGLSERKEWRAPGRARRSASLEPEDTVRFVTPLDHAVIRRGKSIHLFDVSQRFTIADGGIAGLLLSLPEVLIDPGTQSLADAVAEAGLHACEGNHRRAVVLIRGGTLPDRSVTGAAAVRSYLRSMGVPLFVWNVGAPAGPEWGPGEETTSLGSFEKAVRRLRAALAAQRIVWVEGEHLVRDVELGKSPLAARLAGTNDAPPRPAPSGP